jgi:hypothetical protein
MASPLQVEYRTVINEINKQTTASETVRDASGFFSHYIRSAPTSPGDFVRDFSETLTLFPNIKLLQLVWAPTSDATASPSYAISVIDGTNPLQSATKASTPGATAPNPAASGFLGGGPTSESDPILSDGKFQVLIAEAAISPFAGDFRKAINEINTFIAQLNQKPGVSASMIVEPLDVRANATITATDTAATATRSDARFVLKLVRSMKAPRP